VCAQIRRCCSTRRSVSMASSSLTACGSTTSPTAPHPRRSCCACMASPRCVAGLRGLASARACVVRGGCPVSRAKLKPTSVLAVNGPPAVPRRVCARWQFWYSWRHQLRGLSTTHRVVAVDMRGYGESAKPGASWFSSSQYDVHKLAEVRGGGDPRAMHCSTCMRVRVRSRARPTRCARCV
jgi:hypothetical protein